MHSLLSFSLFETANWSLSDHYFAWFTITSGGHNGCVLFSPCVGWIEPSLKICIYMIRLSGLLDLDIYFPLKVMFDYTLIKNSKPTELVGTDWSFPVVSLGFGVMKCTRQNMKTHQEGTWGGRPCKIWWNSSQIPKGWSFWKSHSF